MQTIKLRSGHEMPILGLGTWKNTGNACVAAVKKAIELGYTHIDTAEIYGNQKEVGIGIQGVEREKLFITSKVFHGHLKKDDVINACKQTLKDLQTDYIDLYLIHWPNKEVPIQETFDAMEWLYHNGMIRSFGVSNFTIAHLKEALQIEKEFLPICVNQVEFHPHLNQKELYDFCKSKNIVITAACPLARNSLIGDPTLIKIGQRHKRPATQIALRWLIQKNIIAIPKATTEQHIRSNMNIFDFELSDEEMKEIDELETQERCYAPDINEFDRIG